MLFPILVLLQAEKPTVTVKLDAPSVAVGKPLRGTLTLTLPDGLHGYQNPPAGEYEIPIKLSASDAGLRLTKIDYPKGESMTVGGGDKPTLVYEGTLKIPFTLVASKPGAKGIRLKVDYQLCNTTELLPSRLGHGQGAPEGHPEGDPLTPFDVGDVTVGDGRLTLIAGPCLAESQGLCEEVAGAVQELCREFGFNYVFKASFDKANRTSVETVRGDGMDEGLAIIQGVGQKLGVPTTTDIHLPDQAAPVAAAIDLLQIPAFLCRQTDLLEAAARTRQARQCEEGPVPRASRLRQHRPEAPTPSTPRASCSPSAAPPSATTR